jgi:hypothetical protein
MELKETRIWFPAKIYGWGWGSPNCWQGWAVLAVWVALLCGGMVILIEMRKTILFIVFYMLILQAALILVCLLKGEKPRWRWGKN